MSEREASKTLSENDCLTSSRQYDPQLIFHVSLPRKGFETIDANAFLRLEGLRVLDISGNKLSTLSGLENIAPQLTFLNAAENRLHDISALVKCTALERCFLEGNKLASVASLQPLVALPCLAALVLQRYVPLDNDHMNGRKQRKSEDMLLLDNPVCRDAAAFKEQFLAKVPHVRWVDGALFSSRAKALSGCTAADLNDVTQDSSAAIVDNAVKSFQSIRQKMTTTLNEEAALVRQLEGAARRCNQNAVTERALLPGGQ